MIVFNHLAKANLLSPQQLPGFWRLLSDNSYCPYLLIPCSNFPPSLQITTKLTKFPFIVSFLDLSALQSACSTSGVVGIPLLWNQGDPVFDNDTGSSQTWAQETLKILTDPSIALKIQSKWYGMTDI